MRRDNDNYETPQWAVNALLENHRLPFPIGKILEPCAGSGAIIEAFENRWHGTGITPYSFTAVEIDPTLKESLRWSGARQLHIADFLTWEPDKEFNLIITNPPYSIAQQVVERALEIAENPHRARVTQVAMLLRLSFLESAKRYEFWRRYPLSRLYVLSNRPSFTEGGTDSTGSAWFVWQAGSRPADPVAEEGGGLDGKQTWSVGSTHAHRRAVAQTPCARLRFPSHRAA